MKSVWLVSVWVTLLLCWISCSQALECYRCLHVDGIDEGDIPSGIKDAFEIHKSCKDGRVPESKFSVDCNDSPDSKYSCTKSILGGKLGELKLKVTQRSCIPYTDKEGCIDISPSDIADQLPPDLRQLFDSIQDKSMTMCNCNENGCNSVSRLVSNHVLIFISLICLFGKYLIPKF